MRLTLTRSGGFLGSALPPVVVETTSLSREQQDHVEGLVHAADFFSLPRTLLASQPRPDRFQYDLDIRDEGGRAHRVIFGEESALPSLLKLTQVVRDVGGGG